MEFRYRLQEYREEANVTKTELAKEINVSTGYIVNLEAGRKVPTDDRVQQISKFLKLTPQKTKILLESAMEERLRKKIKREIEVKFSAEEIGVSSKVSLKIVPAYIKVPLLKTAPLSQENWTEDEIETRYELPSNLIKAEKIYFLRVRGDSMAEAGIKEGYKVIVDFQRQPNNDDAVLAWIDDDKYAIRKFYDYDNIIVLRPANSKYEEKTYTRNNIKLRGVVIGVLYI